jgi:hypothetical protein
MFSWAAVFQTLVSVSSYLETSIPQNVYPNRIVSYTEPLNSDFIGAKSEPGEPSLCSDELQVYRLRYSRLEQDFSLLHNVSLLSNEYQKLFPRGKAAGTWSWPLTSI